MMDLVLASGSPVRRKLLANAGFTFRVVRARVDEVLPEDMPPEEAAVALALAKAHEVHARNPGALVIGSDQVLVLPDGTAAGKTDTREEARARIRELAGRTHALVSAAVVVGDRIEEAVADRAEIVFRPLSDPEIDRYLDWHEWEGTAGSYIFESRGIHLVDRLDGDYFTVLGLPLMPLVAALRDLGCAPMVD